MLTLKPALIFQLLWFSLDFLMCQHYLLNVLFLPDFVLYVLYYFLSLFHYLPCLLIFFFALFVIPQSFNSLGTCLFFVCGISFMSYFLVSCFHIFFLLIHSSHSQRCVYFLPSLISTIFFIFHKN